MRKRNSAHIKELLQILIMFNGITYMSITTLNSISIKPVLTYIVIVITLLTDIKITGSYIKQLK